MFVKREYAELVVQIIMTTGDVKRYDVLAWQIMPDHVHLLVFYQNLRAHLSVGARPSVFNGSAGRDTRARGVDEKRSYTISEYMCSVKSYFVHQMRQQYGIEFPFFQKRFYPRIVDTDDYLRRVIEYIRHNPTKAGLSDRFQSLPYQYFDWSAIRRLF